MNFEYSKEIGLDSGITKGRFENEVAIVCGGGSGIGRATVERFINDGASVAIFDINPNFLPFDEKYAKVGFEIFTVKNLPGSTRKLKFSENKILSN